MTCSTFRSLVRCHGLIPEFMDRWLQPLVGDHAGACAACRAARDRHDRIPGLLRRAYEQEVALYVPPTPLRLSTPWAQAPGIAWPWLAAGFATAAATALLGWASLRHPRLRNVVRQSDPRGSIRQANLPRAGASSDPLHARGPAPSVPLNSARGPAPERRMTARDRDDLPAPVHGREVSETPAAPRLVPDVKYLDGSDASLPARWLVEAGEGRAVREWLAKLPPPRDDFVEIPRPLIASLNPSGSLLRDLERSYRQEAEAVDTRLFRRVTLAMKAAPADELCEALRRQTGVEVRAARGVGDEKVTILLEERPARDVMRAVARLFGYKWLRLGEEGKWRYELAQDLKSQLAEEELRARDLDAALLELDNKMTATYGPYRDLGWDQISNRLQSAGDVQKDLVRLNQRTTWGTWQLYQRLTPADRLKLRSGQRLLFTMNDPSPERRLPAEWRDGLIAALGTGVFKFGDITSIGAFNAPGEEAAATPWIALSLTHTELGEAKLVAEQGAMLPSGEDRGHGPVDLVRAESPSAQKPDNARPNQELKNDPAFQREVSIEPEPSCKRPEFRLRGAGFASIPAPHLSSADVWEAVHRASGQPIVADSYTRLYHPVAPFAAKEQRLFDALSTIGDGLRVRWRKDGDFILARSASYFWDKLKEVPARYLRRWQQDRVAHGGLPLADLLEMAALSDQQLDSGRVGDGVSHCWDIPEWQIPAHEPGRSTARFVALLAPAQLQRALQADGMPVTALAPDQLRALAATGWLPDQSAPALAGASLRVQYIPAGQHYWNEMGSPGAPLISADAPPPDPAESARARLWPVAAGATAEQALAAARRLFPAANPGDIHVTRGILVVTVRLADGRGTSIGKGQELP